MWDRGPEGPGFFRLFREMRDPGPCYGDNEWTGGTGKYAGITGRNRFQGVTIAPTSSGCAIRVGGTYDLP